LPSGHLTKLLAPRLDVSLHTGERVGA